MRRLYLGLIAGAVVLFLVISALLARAFSVDGAERSAVTSLIQAEARGDAGTMSSLIDGCSRDAACRGRVATDAAALRRSGSVSIIQIQSSAGFSLTGTVGMARVAWNAGGSLPIVQCVRVRRAGNVVGGMRIELLGITPRLASDARCPSHV